jgi:hypothetical protein
MTAFEPTPRRGLNGAALNDSPMDRIDVSEYHPDDERRSPPEASGDRDVPRERVNFTYNGFFGFPISDWILSHLPKRPSGSH